MLIKKAHSINNYCVYLKRIDISKYTHIYTIETTAPTALSEMAWNIGEAWYIFKEYCKD